MVAKNRGSVEPHFAHHSTAACVAALETMLHKLAKQILEEHQRVTLPEVVASHGTEVRHLRDAMDCPLERISAEPRVDSIQPDIVAHRGKRPVFIEIMVTHGCEEAKLNYLRSNKISAFEIDLSSVARNASLEEMTRQVLDVAPRYWLYHPKQAKAEAELALAAQARARERQRAQEARDAADRAQRQAAAQRYAEAYRQVAVASAYDDPRIQEIRDAGLDQALLPLAGTKCFPVPFQVWQSALIEEFVLTTRVWNKGFWIKDILEFLAAEQLVVADFLAVNSDKALVSEIKRIEPEFQSPSASVIQFLKHLRSQGWVKNGGMGIEADSTRASEAKQKAQKIRQIREDRGEVERQVSSLMGAVGAANTFDMQTWLVTGHSDVQPSPIAVIEAGGKPVQALLRHLKALGAMVAAKGPVVEDLLDLPLEAQREERRRQLADAEARRIQEAEQKAQAEASARKQVLHDLVQRHLASDDAESWWSTRSALREADGISDEQLRTAERSVMDLHYRVVAETQHRNRMEPYRASLREQVLAIDHNADKVDLWLKTSNAELKSAPLNYCVDSAAVSRCVAQFRKDFGRRLR